MVDVELLVDTLDDLRLIRKNRVIGNWYSVYCPFHNNGQERKPSCGVVIHTEYRNGQEYRAGLWHCFSCGATVNIFQIAAVTHGLPYNGEDWYIHTVPKLAEMLGIPYEAKELTPKQAMAEIGCCQSTYYRIQRQLKTA